MDLINKIKRIPDSKYYQQTLATITTLFVSTSHGIAIGWLSPTLLYLKSPELDPPFIITKEQISWIGSLYGLGALVGDICFGVLLNRIGRKWCLYLLAVPNLSAWILIFFSKSHLYLYGARFLFGLTGGGKNFIIPIFLSEISHPSIRGILASAMMLFVSIGILIGFIMSTHLDYYLNPCIIIALPIIYFLAAIRLPETPQYLLKNGKTREAQKAFQYYRNVKVTDMVEYTNGEDADEEDNERDFAELKENVFKNHNTEKVKLKDFTNREVGKAILTTLVLLILHEFSGNFCFFNYMSSIFAAAGTNIAPNNFTIIMGVVMIIGISTSLLMVDWLGRRLLMLISSAGAALGLFLFGFYMRFTNEEMRLEYSWFPLVIMIFIVLVSSVGFVTLVYTIIVEILPPKIRSIGSPTSMVIQSVMIFISLGLFPMILYDYGLDILMFCCGGVCIFCWFYMILFLEETKGINFDK